MEKKYKKIPKLLRIFAFICSLGSLLAIFFLWFYFGAITFSRSIGNEIIHFNSNDFAVFQKITFLKTLGYIIILLFFIIILAHKKKIKATDQIENNPKIVLKNPLKKFFGATIFSFLGILIVYYFTIYDQNIQIKAIPEGYFELSGYATNLQPQDNGFLLTKFFLEKDSTISGFFQAISGEQFIRIQDFGANIESGILATYITGQAYQNKINTFIDTIGLGIHRVGQEKIDNFISDLSGILYTHSFQYPNNITLWQMDDILIHNYERNIIGIRGLYYCHTQDYDRCTQYITLQHSFGDILYRNGGGLTNMLIGYVYVADAIETIGLIIEKYNIPQENLLHFRELLQKPIDSQDIFKKNLLYEHALEINTLQETQTSFFIDKNETKKIFDDYMYHLIENKPYIFQNQPSDIYLSNLYKRIIYPYLNIVGIKNSLGLKLFDSLVPRTNIPISLKQKQDALEQLRKSLGEKIDFLLLQTSIHTIITTDTGAILTGLQQ